MEETKKIPYKELPEDIRQAIESTEIDDAIQEIGKQLELHVDQVGVVYGATNSILLGRLAPEKFIETITKEGKIDPATGVKVVKAVNEKIFLPVRESLKKIHSTGETRQEPMEKKADILRGVESPESIPMKTRVLERGPDTIAPTVAATAVTAAATITPPTVPNAPLGAATPPPQPMPAAPVKPRPTIDPYREQAK